MKVAWACDRLFSTSRTMRLSLCGVSLYRNIRLTCFFAEYPTSLIFTWYSEFSVNEAVFGTIFFCPKALCDAW